jgi:hypothetical protein
VLALVGSQGGSFVERRVDGRHPDDCPRRREGPPGNADTTSPGTADDRAGEHRQFGGPQCVGPPPHPSSIAARWVKVVDSEKPRGVSSSRISDGVKKLSHGSPPAR